MRCVGVRGARQQRSGNSRGASRRTRRAHRRRHSPGSVAPNILTHHQHHHPISTHAHTGHRKHSKFIRFVRERKRHTEEQVSTTTTQSPEHESSRQQISPRKHSFDSPRSCALYPTTTTTISRSGVVHAHAATNSIKCFQFTITSQPTSTEFYPLIKHNVWQASVERVSPLDQWWTQTYKNWRIAEPLC